MNLSAFHIYGIAFSVKLKIIIKKMLNLKLFSGFDRKYEFFRLTLKFLNT